MRIRFNHMDSRRSLGKAFAANTEAESGVRPDGISSEGQALAGIVPKNTDMTGVQTAVAELESFDELKEKLLDLTDLRTAAQYPLRRTQIEWFVNDIRDTFNLEIDKSNLAQCTSFDAVTQLVLDTKINEIKSDDSADPQSLRDLALEQLLKTSEDLNIE